MAFNIFRRCGDWKASAAETDQQKENKKKKEKRKEILPNILDHIGDNKT